MNPAILAVLILLSMLAPPCVGADSKTAAAKAPAQGFSAQDDKLIEAAIRAKLAKSKIGKDGFTVHVQGGVTYWEGTTTIPQHKGAATRMAHSAGTPTVINNIKVTMSRPNQTGAVPTAARPTPAAPASTASPAAGASPNTAVKGSTNSTTAAPSTTPAATSAATSDSGLRRVQVKPASQNVPPQ